MSTRFWSDPSFVKHSPIFSGVVFEYANISQIIRMWTEHTAAGQSLTAWIAVFFGLALYSNFYRVFLPEQVIARVINGMGLLANLAVIVSVIWFRFLA